MTDAELISRANGTSSDTQRAEAWNTLSERYLPIAWRYAYALLQDSHAAEDVVSEAMMALLKNIGQIDAQAPKISAWLRSVVRHKVADHHRRTYRAKDHLPQIAQEVLNKNGEHHRDNPYDPAANMLATEQKSRITEILERLPERQRLVLEWKYLEDLRVRKIAERLGETEKAVEATLYRARREFRRLYELSEPKTEDVKNSKPITSPNIGCAWQALNFGLPKK